VLIGVGTADVRVGDLLAGYQRHHFGEIPWPRQDLGKLIRQLLVGPQPRSHDPHWGFAPHPRAANCSPTIEPIKPRVRATRRLVVVVGRIGRRYAHFRFSPGARSAVFGKPLSSAQRKEAVAGDPSDERWTVESLEMFRDGQGVLGRDSLQHST
jgi:hypothetical protein